MNTSATTSIVLASAFAALLLTACSGAPEVPSSDGTTAADAQEMMAAPESAGGVCGSSCSVSCANGSCSASTPRGSTVVVCCSCESGTPRCGD